MKSELPLVHHVGQVAESVLNIKGGSLHKYQGIPEHQLLFRDLDLKNLPCSDFQLENHFLDLAVMIFQPEMLSKSASYVSSIVGDYILYI